MRYATNFVYRSIDAIPEQNSLGRRIGVAGFAKALAVMGGGTAAVYYGVPLAIVIGVASTGFVLAKMSKNLGGQQYMGWPGLFVFMTMGLATLASAVSPGWLLLLPFLGWFFVASTEVSNTYDGQRQGDGNCCCDDVFVHLYGLYGVPYRW